jgi:hypothetical protein
MDGFVPTADSVANVRSFFSGHYQQYGINVQACCDAYCRFTTFSATSPGGTNDALAFLKWKFSKCLKDLMEAFIVLGDNAYVIDYRNTPHAEFAQFLLDSFNPL